MKHVLFAEFNDPTAATAAVRDLEGTGVRLSRVNVHTETNQDNEERPMHETDARSGIAIGVFFAAVIGAFMGWMVAGPLGLFPVPVLTAVMSGMALGLGIGFIGGAISGAMNPNRQLQKMEQGAEKRGNVVATIELDGVDQEESVRKVFQSHGARVETRTV